MDHFESSLPEPGPPGGSNQRDGSDNHFIDIHIKRECSTNADKYAESCIAFVKTEPKTPIGRSDEEEYTEICVKQESFRNEEHFSSVKLVEENDGGSNSRIKQECFWSPNRHAEPHLSAVKLEPGPRTESDNEGICDRKPYTNTNLSFPNIKQEFSDNSRSTKQYFDLPAIKGEPNLRTESDDESVGSGGPNTDKDIKQEYSWNANKYAGPRTSTVKPEAGPSARSGDGEQYIKEIYTDIDISFPDVKQECLEYARNTKQHTGGFFRRQDSSTVVPPTLPGTSSEYDKCTANNNVHILNKKPFSCSQCSYRCKLRGDLTKHMLAHTEDKPFSCLLCSYTSKRKGDLKSHELIHAGNKSFSCSQCTYTSIRREGLRKHWLTHTTEKPFLCPQCTYTCKDIGYLRKHMHTHSEHKPFSCSLCPHTCKDIGCLKIHMLTHTEEKPFSCSQCAYTCNQKGNLRKHLLTHSGDKPFSCSRCSYKCKRKGDLRSHVLTHNGEKSLCCPHCTYTTKRKGGLKKHMLIHIGDKKFSCSLCSYISYQKAHLNTHMLTHTGQKPYSCSHCAYACKQSGNMKRHMRTHTRNKKCHVPSTLTNVSEIDE